LSYGNEHRFAGLFEESVLDRSGVFPRSAGARRSPSQIPIQEQADVLLLTEANRKDVGFVDSFTLDPGSIVALDCGHTDYVRFSRWTVGRR